MMNVIALLLVAGGYLMGSIPMAYLAGRWLRGIDLRRYGSGTVSGGMVYEHVARWAVVPVGLFDVFKAALPTWLALRLELGMPVVAVTGLAAVAGHAWPVFFHFTGGRGTSCFLGVQLVLFPWGVAWTLVFLTIGWRLRNPGPLTLVAYATLPLLAYAVDGPPIVAPLAGGMLLLTFIKRLEANRRPLPPPGPERRRVVLRRLFLDRDILSHTEWVRQLPESEAVSPEEEPRT